MPFIFFRVALKKKTRPQTKILIKNKFLSLKNTKKINLIFGGFLNELKRSKFFNIHNIHIESECTVNTHSVYHGVFRI
jgi:hypothetical protein